MRRFWALVAVVALLTGLIGPGAYAQGPVPPDKPPQASAAVSTGTDPARAKRAAREPEAPSGPQAAWPGPDGYSYLGSSCAFHWVEISSTGVLVPDLTDDGYQGPLDLGLNFSFYGTLYNQFYVAANGYLTLGAGSGVATNQCPLPSDTAPNNVIALMWDDLFPNYVTGGVYYQYFAGCPVGVGECTVVEYLNWAHFGGGYPLAGTFEAILYPDGRVIMQFLDSGVEMGSESTTGIENSDAADDYGLTYACNAGSSIADNTCLAYDRPVVPSYGSSHKSAPESALPGDVLTYTVTVRNTGAAAGDDTTMIDPLPNGTTFSRIVSPPDMVYNAPLNRVEWNGSVGAGESIDLVFDVTVDADAPCGTPIINTATITDPSAVREVMVAAGTTVWGYRLYASDFEADSGGFVAGGATSFAWGEPTSGPGAAHSGAKTWATNLSGNYGNGEDGYITSSPIDLRAVIPEPGDPLLVEWWQWLQTESGYDRASVEVRGGGVDWTSIYGPASGSADLVWTSHSVDISAFAGAPDFQLRFHFTSDESITYPGWYVDNVSIHMCNAPQTGLYLGPSVVESYGCNGESTDHTFFLYNNTDVAGAFGLAYTVPTDNGALTGPVSLTLASGQRQNFSVTLSAGLCAPPGGHVVGRIEASGNGFSDDAVLTRTIRAADVWATVPGSAPEWAGSGYAGDGCTARNTAGDWVTYILGDASGDGPTGFWGYNYTTKSWFQPGAASTPADRWAPDWAYDDQANLCYLTGGANMPGSGNLSAAYVYDPVANAFTALPAFTTARDFHDSWVGLVDGVKYLCIGGGNGGDLALVSTQCYEIVGAAWAAEDATIGAYPTDIWAAADGTLHASGGDQFWVVSGIQGGAVTGVARYFDDADNAWHTAGYTGEALYRVEGEFYEGAFYQIGGSSGNFNYVATTLRGVYNGSSWNWTQLDDAPNARMDNVVAVTPGTVWSIDGYGSQSADYVDYLFFCPSCDRHGRLRGTVMDGETGGLACQDAVVHIAPANVDALVDPATGIYGPVILNEGVYQITAAASGYVGDSATVTITNETTVTVNATLERAVVDTSPVSLSVTATAGFPMIRTLAVGNLGHQPLSWELREIEPSRALEDSPFNQGKQMVAAVGVDPFIAEQFAQATDGLADFFVAFWNTADLGGADSLRTKADKVQYVRNALRTAADKAQANVRAFLEGRGVAYQVFYIDNTILVHGDQSLLEDLSKFPEVSGFHGNHTYSLMPVESNAPAPAPSGTIPWDIGVMQIDRVWNELGVTGEGVIVANVDTGVYYQHEALFPNYLCGSGPHTDCWFDPENGTDIPNDSDGHGTKTMSQMAADNDPAFQYSVGGAPDAGWIACQGCPGGTCPDSALNACADWLVMTTPHTPDVVNNSWGNWAALCDYWYDGKIAAYRAAGIVPVWAAGNIGNACSTSTPPANSIGTLAVGATTASDTQAAFSSTGPGLCSGRTQFPDVSAPGENTCVALNSGGYSCTASGTSFAAPRAAGCAALLKSANPDLTVDEIIATLLATADNKPDTGCGSPQDDPNYRYGDGRINCYNAVDAINQRDIPWVREEPTSGTVPPVDSATVDLIFYCTLDDVGQTYTGTLRIVHDDPCQGLVDVALQLTCTGGGGPRYRAYLPVVLK